MSSIINYSLKLGSLIVCIFSLGILFPLLVSVFVSFFSEFAFSDCVTSACFWIATVIGWFIFFFVLMEMYDKKEKN